MRDARVTELGESLPRLGSRKGVNRWCRAEGRGQGWWCCDAPAACDGAPPSGAERAAVACPAPSFAAQFRAAASVWLPGSAEVPQFEHTNRSRLSGALKAGCSRLAHESGTAILLVQADRAQRRNGCRPPLVCRACGRGALWQPRWNFGGGRDNHLGSSGRRTAPPEASAAGAAAHRRPAAAAAPARGSAAASRPTAARCASALHVWHTR